MTSDNQDDVAPGDWYPYENGVTQGARGPEGGVVLRDDELGDPADEEDADARLTLERADPKGALGASTPAFTITANLYGGWMLHVAGFATEDAAQTAFAAMKPELEALADLIPDENDRDIAGGVHRLNESVADFEERYERA